MPLNFIQCSSSWSRTWWFSPSLALSSFSLTHDGIKTLLQMMHPSIWWCIYWWTPSTLSRSPTLLLHSSSCPSSHNPTWAQTGGMSIVLKTCIWLKIEGVNEHGNLPCPACLSARVGAKVSTCRLDLMNIYQYNVNLVVVWLLKLNWIGENT